MKLKVITTVLCTGFGVVGIMMISSCATGPGGGAAPAQVPESAANPSSSVLLSGDMTRMRTEQRSGLGTGWGNEVYSSINYTNFIRSSSKPAGVSSIYYNDKQGISAMAGPWSYSGKGMQKAAGGLVEWGVKSGWSTLKSIHSSRHVSPAAGNRYVVGRKNSNYSLVVKNLCHSRLEIVLSVDGLDVMDGKPAAYRKRGYIVQPGKTLTVDGFRTSESAVASFKFSSVSGSYSNQRHGQTRNVGVIGMAVFKQKGVDPWKWARPDIDRRHGATPFAEAPYSKTN